MTTDDYITKEILYTHGHKCIPNGVGDYQMVCPDGEVVKGFIPFMMRAVIKGLCTRCNKTLKVIE